MSTMKSLSFKDSSEFIATLISGVELWTTPYCSLKYYPEDGQFRFSTGESCDVSSVKINNWSIKQREPQFGEVWLVQGHPTVYGVGGLASLTGHGVWGVDDPCVEPAYAAPNVEVWVARKIVDKHKLDNEIMGDDLASYIEVNAVLKAAMLEEE